MSLCALNSFGVNSFQNVQMCNLAHASQNQRYNLDQFNNTRSFSVIDYSKPGNGLYERTDGSIGVIPKSPAEVLGEQILRPVIDKTVSLGKNSFELIKQGFYKADKITTKIFNIIPGAQAKNIRILENLNGDNSNDIFNYSNGDGKVTIFEPENSSSFDKIVMASGLSKESVYLNRELGGDGRELYINFYSNSNDQIAINNFFTSDGAITNPQKIEKIEFEDGGSIDLSQPLELFSKSNIIF